MNFEKIYVQNRKMVYNLALQYVQNIEDAEEITQDIFVKIAEKMDSFQKSSDVKTWIYRISINQCLDFIKAKNAKKRSIWGSLVRLNDPQNYYQPAHFDHPGVILEQKEEIQKIFEGINQLPPQQKTVIILLKIDGRTQTETAKIMELGEKAVESLFQRAKKNLTTLLNKNEG